MKLLTSGDGSHSNWPEKCLHSPQPLVDGGGEGAVKEIRHQLGEKMCRKASVAMGRQVGNKPIRDDGDRLCVNVCVSTYEGPRHMSPRNGQQGLYKLDCCERETESVCVVTSLDLLLLS